MIPRHAQALLTELLRTNAAVVLLGPRQVGKTTLARGIEWPAGVVYLDLERPADRRRLDDADAYLRAQSPSLVILDEVHRAPELFPILRGVIDDNRRAGHRSGQFLLLGSASLDLMSLSSKSLAGRVAHVDLPGVAIDEAAEVGLASDDVWLRGGFPDSLLAPSDGASLQWRTDLIRTYLEREIPFFAPRIPSETLRRLWTMTAHSNSGLLNVSRLASGIGVSGPTVDRYLDLLADLGLVRRLPSWQANIGKRMTKAPKIMVRDSGLTHALLEISDLDALLGHPAAGPSYESFVVENMIAAVGGNWQPYHFRTATGDEIDLVLVRGGRPDIAVAIKRSTAPSLGAGARRAMDLLRPRQKYLVHPDADHDPYLSHGITVIGLSALIGELRRAG